ncbi:hypothetical protein HK104_004100 [Borealophlyctis nickersoniae]|nr:hypothetical protein HK104_004100 [Borealophlyctis nickersoniae]
MSAPSHPLLLRAAQVVTENVEREKLHPYPYKEDKMKILMRTGPGAWSDAVNEYIRQYNYRDFDVAPGNVTLGDVKFLDVGSLRDGLIKHHFAHSWHED